MNLFEKEDKKKKKGNGRSLYYQEASRGVSCTIEQKSPLSVSTKLGNREKYHKKYRS